MGILYSPWDGYYLRILTHEFLVLQIAPKGAVLQICILQMALAELESTGTPPNVVVNEVNYWIQFFLSWNQIVHSLLNSGFFLLLLSFAFGFMEFSLNDPLSMQAVELAKRFCDLAAPRIINGCLGSYTRRRQFQAKSRAEKTQKEELELPLDTLQPEDLGWNETYHD